MTTLPPITILYGGWSGERPVSQNGGRCVAEALTRLGLPHRLLDVTRDLMQWIPELLAWPDTLVFNALHGPGGEDGTIQGILDTLGVRYTHSGRLASALAMHKIQSKLIAEDIGLYTAPCWRIDERTPDDFWDTLPYPLVLKPVDEGSSLGVFIVGDASQARSCVPQLPPSFMAEGYVPGRELTVGIVEGRPLTIIEIDAGPGFYDYKAKYDPNHHADFIIPAPLDKALTQTLQDQSVALYHAMGCEGVARVDWRYDPAASTGPAFLEINTQPGMTPLSLVPAAAAYEGMSYDALVLKILGGGGVINL